MKIKLHSHNIKTLFTIAFLFVFSFSNGQIASWTYEPLQGTTANPTPNTGAGSSSVINNGGGIISPGTATGMSGTGCGAQNGATAWALNPFDPGAANESNGAQFSVSTLGYQNIIITWDQRWSNTSANTVRVQYTTNGLTWTNFNMTSGNTTYCNGSINGNGCFETSAVGDLYRRLTVDFSAITAANNNPNFAVRILASYYQATAEFRQSASPGTVAGIAGTWRFDNVSINGTLLPGPTASVMSGTVSVCAGSSANLAVTITGGTGPFTLVYSDGTSNFTINNYISGTAISVSPGSTKTYTIVSVTNANGAVGSGNSGSAVVTIKLNPVVTATNITSCAVGAVALTGGAPAGGTYSIANPYSGATTTFTYTYTNGSGCTKTSPVVTFTRNSLPVFTTQPSTGTQTQCQGDPFTAVTIVATGSGILTYQWYSNTTATTTGGTPLTSITYVANGSKTASFTPLSTTVGTTYYYVIVTNSCGSVKSGNSTGLFTVSPASVAGTANSAQTICAGTSPGDLVLSGQSGSVVKWQKADDSAFTIGVSDISNTSTTLTGVAIGTLSQTTYFRAVVQNGSCSVVSTPGVQILIKTTTWNGTWSNGVPDSMTTAIFAGNYSSAGNLNACTVLVNSGNVVFNSGDILTIENGLTIAGGTMTFENNASLVQVNNTANSGDITYKRNTTPMRKYDYTYWSSPVSFQTLVNLSPNTLADKYFWWNTTIYNWSSVTAPGITTMDNGKGYIIRGPQTFDPVVPAVFYGSFIGTPNNGDVIIPIDVSSPVNNLNLIGNPYPSAVSADLFMSDAANTASIGTGSSIYLWTHNSPFSGGVYSASDYATYNYTGGAGTAPSSGANNATPNGFIAAGQSFMIKGLATGSATFKNSMRIGTNNNQFFRTAASALEKNRIWLELKNSQGAYKQALVGYIQNATNAFDNGFDGEILESGNSVSLYSVLAGTKLTIQGRALPFDQAEQVSLGYRTTIAGDFEIKLSDFDGLFLDQAVYLEDLLLNVIHNLKQSPYFFSTTVGTCDTRFVLRFTDNTLNTPAAILNENAIVIYKNHDQIDISTSTTAMAGVKIFDVSGRLLLEKNGINASETTLVSVLTNQILLLQIKLSDGQVINRKFLN